MKWESHIIPILGYLSISPELRDGLGGTHFTTKALIYDKLYS